MEEEDKKRPVSSLQCTPSYTHLTAWVKSTPRQEHPCSSAGWGAPSCAAPESWAAGEQHCSPPHSLTLKDAAFSCCRHVAKAALKQNFIFFFGVGGLNDFKLENAEMASGAEAC